jgi:hypothetical protein
MSWRSVFGLDPVEFIIFWAVSITVGITLGVMADMPELSFGVFAVAGALYAFVRRHAMRNLPVLESRKLDEVVAQLQDDQIAASEFFERRIAELEERLDFAERMLARGHDERLKAEN